MKSKPLTPASFADERPKLIALQENTNVQITNQSNAPDPWSVKIKFQDEIVTQQSCKTRADAERSVYELLASYGCDEKSLEVICAFFEADYMQKKAFKPWREPSSSLSFFTSLA